MNEWLGLLFAAPLIYFFLIAAAVVLIPILFIPFLKQTRGGFWQIVIFMVVGYLLYDFFIGY